MVDKTEDVSTSLKRYKEAASASIATIAARTMVAAIPWAGGSILELWDGIALRRTQERLNTVFEEMKERLESISVEKVDRSFFDSEEFQTLLYLVLERLHTTHDREKLRMFGAVLANCGNADFKEDDKEQYVRTLRDLGLEDIQVLKEVAEATARGLPRPAHLLSARFRKEAVLDTAAASLSRLASLGLVSESIDNPEFNPRMSGVSASSSPDDYVRIFKKIMHDYFERRPSLQYRISKFGRRFLDFAASPDQAPSAHDPD